MPWRSVNALVFNGSKVNKPAQTSHPTMSCSASLGWMGSQSNKVLEIVGAPIKTPLVTDSGEPHQLSTAPQYVVYPVEWENVNASYFSNEPCVNDLGEAFKVSNPPKELGIPPPYRSPELFLEKSDPSAAGFGTDIWALGCTIFEIRTGRKFFNLFDDDDDSYLDAMVKVLGEMPEPWSATWEIRKRSWQDEADDSGREVPVKVLPMEIGESVSNTDKVTIDPCVAEGARSLEDMLGPGVWYVDTCGLGDNSHRDITDKEKKLFANLLSLLLKWQPQERISAEEALRHEWFKM